jgi:DNA polymerase-3 subunit beta
LAKKQAPLVIVDPTVQFSTTTDTLAKVLAQAVRFTGQFGELPKGSVRVEAHDDGTVTAIGMSMDSAILIRFDAKVETPGVVVLPAALAAPMLKALPDSKVTVTVDTSLTAHFEAAVSSRFSLRCWAGDAAVPFRFGFEVRQELNAEEATRFSDAVAFAETAASTDDSRPLLTGILIDDEHVVATDSYRLAATYTHVAVPPMLCPAAVLREAIKLGTITAVGAPHEGGGRAILLAVSGKAPFADCLIYGRLIEGDFPNWQGLMPDIARSPRTFQVVASELSASIRQLETLAKDGSATPIRLTLEAGACLLSVHASDVGHGEVEIDGVYTGEPLTVAFNPRYLREGLDALDDDTVTLHLTDALKPAVLTGATGIRKCLIMPVRVA